MKPINYVIFLLFLINSKSSFAQDESPFDIDTQLFGVSYGLVTPYKNIVANANVSGIVSAQSSVKITAFGPLGLRYEKAVTDRVSVGANFVIGTLKAVDNTSINAFGTVDNSESTVKLSYWALILRGNYHFGNSSKFDPYAGIGLGYGNFKVTATASTGQNLGTVNASVPGAVGFTAQVGGHYYVTDNIALMAEVGLMIGSFLQFGVITKF